MVKSISTILRKLLKSFNGRAISIFLVLLSLGVLPAIFALNLKDSESVTLAFGSSPQYCHKYFNF